MTTISNFSSKKPLIDQFKDTGVSVSLPFKADNFKCSNDVTCGCKSKHDKKDLSITVDKTLKKDKDNGDNI